VERRESASGAQPWEQVALTRQNPEGVALGERNHVSIIGQCSRPHVYSTKNREPWLKDPNLCNELYAYNATILRSEVDSPAILINAVEDHIHILCRLSRKVAIMDVLKVSKTGTSNGSRSRISC